MKLEPNTETNMTAKLSRSCGTCSACCTWVGVEELNKPVGKTCVHLNGNSTCRCGIYTDRPSSCQTYHCGWLQGLGVESPNQCGFVVTLYADSTSIWIFNSFTPQDFLTGTAVPLRQMVDQIASQTEILPEKTRTEINLIFWRLKQAILVRDENIYLARPFPDKTDINRWRFAAVPDPIAKIKFQRKEGTSI